LAFPISHLDRIAVSLQCFVILLRVRIFNSAAQAGPQAWHYFGAFVSARRLITLRRAETSTPIPFNFNLTNNGRENMADQRQENQGTGQQEDQQAPGRQQGGDRESGSRQGGGQGAGRQDDRENPAERT
jgi:hypothetical protein